MWPLGTEVSGGQGGGPGLVVGVDALDDFSWAPQVTGTPRLAPLGTPACGNTPRHPSSNHLQELRPLWGLGAM